MVGGRLEPGQQPTVFIGSSTEGMRYAQALQVLLDHECEVEIWNQGTFGLMGTSLESLVAAAERFDFAILVVTADDTTVSRGRKRPTARDNVLFELGLFMGALGRERTFMVFDRTRPPDLPSDLAGVTAATFAPHSSGNVDAALGSASTQIHRAIEKHKNASRDALMAMPYDDMAVEVLKVAARKAWATLHIAPRTEWDDRFKVMNLTSSYEVKIIVHINPVFRDDFVADRLVEDCARRADPKRVVLLLISKFPTSDEFLARVRQTCRVRACVMESPDDVEKLHTSIRSAIGVAPFFEEEASNEWEYPIDDEAT